MQRKQNVEAEKEFTSVLKLNPASAQVSYWLAQVVLAQANPKKNSLAIFSFARAATYDGPGALAPEGRQKVDSYLTQLYTKFAGTQEGLAELKSQAKVSTFPPTGLGIKSSAVRKFEHQQKMRKEHPLRYVFIDLKANLRGPNGDAIWGDLNGKLTPEMRLIVVGSEPPERPKTVRLTSTERGRTEVVLNLENRLRSGLRTGSELKFEGVAAALTKEPFRLTLNYGKVLPLSARHFEAGQPLREVSTRTAGAQHKINCAEVQSRFNLNYALRAAPEEGWQRLSREGPLGDPRKHGVKR